MPYFWAGFFSFFSASNFYEPYTQQLYSCPYTFVPIIWYAVFDFQYKKEEFMKNPDHYEYGLLGLGISKFTFLQWILYSFWQSLMIYMICTYPYEENGGSYWLEGSFVYSSVVLLANLKVVSDSQSLDFWIIFWVFFSIFIYQVLDLVFSIIPSTEIAGTFKMKLWTWEFYAGSLFMTIAILSVDVGLNYFIK